MYRLHYFVHISVYLHLGPTLEIMCWFFFITFLPCPKKIISRFVKSDVCLRFQSVTDSDKYFSPEYNEAKIVSVIFLTQWFTNNNDKEDQLGKHVYRRNFCHTLLLRYINRSSWFNCSFKKIKTNSEHALWTTEFLKNVKKIWSRISNISNKIRTFAKEYWGCQAGAVRVR